ERVQPAAWMPDRDREPARHQDLAEVVDVARRAPQSADEHAQLPIDERGLLEWSEPRTIRLRLEYELLQVRASRERPAGNKQRDRGDVPDRASLGLDGAGREPRADAIEERIEREAAPAELEANALGDEVVCIKMHAFEPQIVDEEEAEHRRVHDDARRRLEAEHVVRRERQQQ